MITMPYTHVSVKALVRPYEALLRHSPYDAMSYTLVLTCPHFFFWRAGGAQVQGGIRKRSECLFLFVFPLIFFPKSRPHSSGLGSAKLRHALVQALATSN